MKHLIAFVSLLSLTLAALAQEVTDVSRDSSSVGVDSVKVKSVSCTLSGRVTDEDGKPLPLVAVKVEGQMAGGVTNLDGHYSFDFQSGDSVVVGYSLMGFERKKKVLVRPQGKLTWNVSLRSSGTDMGELTVTEVRRQMGSTQELSTEDLKRLPSTSGNAVEELVATQAGVSTQNCHRSIMSEAVRLTRTVSTSTALKSIVRCSFPAVSRKVCRSSIPTW